MVGEGFAAVVDFHEYARRVFQIERNRAQTTRETTKREFERAENLHQQGLLSDEAFETARKNAEDAAQAAELTELALSRTVIRAPFGGTVLRRHTLDEFAPIFGEQFSNTFSAGWVTSPP